MKWSTRITCKERTKGSRKRQVSVLDVVPPGGQLRAHERDLPARGLAAPRQLALAATPAPTLTAPPGPPRPPRTPYGAAPQVPHGESPSASYEYIFSLSLCQSMTRSTIF